MENNCEDVRRDARQRTDDPSVQSPIPLRQNKQKSSTPHCPAYAALGSRISFYRCGSYLRVIVGSIYEVSDCPKGNAMWHQAQELPGRGLELELPTVEFVMPPRNCKSRLSPVSTQ